MTENISVEVIATRIVVVRGKRVMLDSDLAKLYGVETKYLLRQVRRNLERFPSDFMYLLVKKEVVNLRCQNVTSSYGGRRYMPYAFTQEGIAMLSSVLNSSRAIQVNIQIMRAFVMLKEILLTHKDLALKIEDLERKYAGHDHAIQQIFEVIRQLMEPKSEPPPAPEKPPIEFK